MTDWDNEHIEPDIEERCKHCKTAIYRDSRRYWRHEGWVSHCRTKAIGPDEKCWCGREH